MHENRLLRPLLMFLGELLFWASILGLGARYFPNHFDPLVGSMLQTPILWTSLICGLILYNVGKRSLRAFPFRVSKPTFLIVIAPVILIYYLRLPLMLLRIFAPDLAPIVGLSVPPLGITDTIVWLVGFVAAGTLGEIAGFYGAFAMMQDADELRTKDPRPPIIYLRSFRREHEKAMPIGRLDDIRLIRKARKLGYAPNEAMYQQIIFAQFFTPFGPYIAIGRPNLKAIRVSAGAAEKFVSDADWQDVVSKWMKEAAAVVFEVDSTEGLLWEMEHAVKWIKPNTILIILPKENDEYAAFAWTSSRLFPKGLPPGSPESRLISFTADWEPLGLPKGKSLRETLTPFLKQLR